MRSLVNSILSALLYFIVFVLIDRVFRYFILPLELSIIVRNLLRYIIVFTLPILIYFFITKKDYKVVLRLNKCNFSVLKTIDLYAFVFSSYALGGFISIFYTMLNKSISIQLIMLDSIPFFKIILLGVVIAPVYEEILMRGIILHKLSTLPFIYAAILNGIIFGLFHENINQFFVTSFAGFAFAYVTLLTDSIYISLFFHGLINFLSATGNLLIKSEQLLKNHLEFKWYTFIIIIVLIIVAGANFIIAFKNINNTLINKKTI